MNKNKNPRKVYVAVPAMDEADYLPLLIECLRDQTFRNFSVYICVNQPDSWWEQDDRISVCRNNQNSIEYLASVKELDIQIIDKSNKGKGWDEKKSGVGWARRILMDRITTDAENADIIVSMDADTLFGSGYLMSVVQNFEQHQQAVALSVPYYHNLTGDPAKDIAILRYEIYMRYYAINMWRIQSPYSFTAIGSAMALPASSYKAIGGITPHKSGEDFYFMQKLRKFGEVVFWNREKVYPAARYSNRVGFGTGPAMIKGKEGDWASYPIYPFEYFNEIKSTYDLFSQLFVINVNTPLDEFIFEKFGTKNIWDPLRENVKTRDKFVQACHHKIDGFRIFQYLKWRNDNSGCTDEENLIRFFKKFYPELLIKLDFDINMLDFTRTDIKKLDGLRKLLLSIEEKYQKDAYIAQLK